MRIDRITPYLFGYKKNLTPCQKENSAENYSCSHKKEESGDDKRQFNSDVGRHFVKRSTPLHSVGGSLIGQGIDIEVIPNPPIQGPPPINIGPYAAG